jgi:tetratricopeptide (TPR) repeat protein
MRFQTERAQLLFNKAVSAEEEGHLKKALRLYYQVAEVDRHSALPRFCIASVLFEQGNWRDAIKVASQINTRWPDSHHVSALLGLSYSKLAQFKRAEQAFRQSLSIKPEASTWVLLSDVLLRLGREDEWIACLRCALKLNPNYEEAHYNLGCGYQLRRQYARAEKHLRRAIEIDPRYSLAYAELGWILVRCQNRARYPNKVIEGIRLLKKSIRLDPDYGWSRIYLANALWGMKKIKAADEQYRKAMELWPNESISYWCYGGFLAYEGNDDSLAEQYLRRAVELDPKDEEANYNLGKHLYNWNRTDEAMKYLRKVAKKGHERAAENIRKIEGQKGGKK